MPLQLEKEFGSYGFLDEVIHSLAARRCTSRARKGRCSYSLRFTHYEVSSLPTTAGKFVHIPPNTRRSQAAFREGIPSRGSLAAKILEAMKSYG